jgi:hypothetical protein
MKRKDVIAENNLLREYIRLLCDQTERRSGICIENIDAVVAWRAAHPGLLDAAVPHGL